MMMRTLTVVLMALAVPMLWAQTPRRTSADNGILYNEEKAVEFRLHTHGFWNVNIMKGYIRSYYRTPFYRIGLGEIRHHKEISKTSEPQSFTATSAIRNYTFGKQNYALALRASVGVKRYYSEKADKNGVAVALSYSGGFTAGLLTPYYLDIVNSRNEPNPQPVKYTPETANVFLDAYRIQGKAGFLTGIGETKVRPGAHAQVGVHLDWGATDAFLKAVEAGLMLDVFPKALPIMVSEENRAYFLNLYVSLHFGKRN